MKQDKTSLIDSLIKELHDLKNMKAGSVHEEWKIGYEEGLLYTLGLVLDGEKIPFVGEKWIILDWEGKVLKYTKNTK